MQQQHQLGGGFELPPAGTCKLIGSVGAAKLAYATLHNVSESHQLWSRYTSVVSLCSESNSQ